MNRLWLTVVPLFLNLCLFQSEGIFPTFNQQTLNFDQNLSQTQKIPIEKFCERFYNYERSSRGNSQVKIVPGAKVDNLGLNSTSSVSKPNSAHSARSNNIRENQIEPLPIKREKSVLNQQLDNPDVEQADQKIEKKLAQKSNFKVNPFYNEIFQTFLSEPKKGINFSEFVEIMNVFSSQIDVDCKASWIFEVLAKIDDRNQVSYNENENKTQNQNDDSQESNLSNGYTQKLSRDQLKTYIIRISEEGDSEEELGENPIDQEEMDEDMTYSQIIERTLHGQLMFSDENDVNKLTILKRFC